MNDHKHLCIQNGGGVYIRDSHLPSVKPVSSYVL